MWLPLGLPLRGSAHAESGSVFLAFLMFSRVMGFCGFDFYFANFSGLIFFC
jgi:hypothetical protein